MFSNFDCGTVKMSLKNKIALVSRAKAGRNISELHFLVSFCPDSSARMSNALILH